MEAISNLNRFSPNIGKDRIISQYNYIKIIYGRAEIDKSTQKEILSRMV